MTVDSLASKFLQSKKRVVGDVDGLEWGGFAGILECMMDYGEEEEEKKEKNIFHKKGVMMLDLFVKGKLPLPLPNDTSNHPCLFHTLSTPSLFSSKNTPDFRRPSHLPIIHLPSPMYSPPSPSLIPRSSSGATVKMHFCKQW